MDTNWNEHYIKREDNKKEGETLGNTYYIIRRRWEGTGLFTRYNMIAGHIRYALSNGWLPVVDMQNYPNPYLSPEKFGKENSWEYFFEQPLRIGLEQAYSGENVILSNGEEIYFRPYETNYFFENQNGIQTEWRTLVKLGLLKVKPSVYQEILEIRNKLFSSNDKILGVLMRGTDYLVKRPKYHPIPPSIEFALSIVFTKFKEWKCNKIFLATEDKSIVQNFRNVFKDLLVTFDREYVDYNSRDTVEQPVGLCRINRENDHFLQGKDYLSQMIILSTCHNLVAARCGGAVGVMLMTNGFENTYFFNLGRYGVVSLD